MSLTAIVSKIFLARQRELEKHYTQAESLQRAVAEMERSERDAGRAERDQEGRERVGRLRDLREGVFDATGGHDLLGGV